MNQHQAGTAANPPGTGLEYRDPALSRPLAERAAWTDADVRAVDTARLLAADAVQQAGNGHPGTAMSLAPLAYLLFQQILVHDPGDDQWLGRDRFVLSAGHTSLTLYDAEHGARPGGRPATFAPGSGGTADRPA